MLLSVFKWNVVKLLCSWKLRVVLLLWPVVCVVVVVVITFFTERLKPVGEGSGLLLYKFGWWWNVHAC